MMTQELITLGGAAAWPNPGQGCSSYLVQSPSSTIVLDCGPDTLLELRKHTAFESVSAIVISHCHSDHILDLVTYRYGLVYGPQASSTENRKIPIWLPPQGIDVLHRLGDALSGQGERSEDFWDTVFELRQYDPDKPLKIDETTLTFAKTQHFTECYAIRIVTGSGQVLTYTADTGSIERLQDFALGSDLLIAEATLSPELQIAPDLRGHLTPADAGSLAAAARVKALILTHLWHERPDSEVIDQASSYYKGPISIAKPGARYEF